MVRRRKGSLQRIRYSNSVINDLNVNFLHLLLLAIIHLEIVVMSKTSTRAKDAGTVKFVPGKEAENRPALP